MVRVLYDEITESAVKKAVASLCRWNRSYFAPALEKAQKLAPSIEKKRTERYYQV